MQVYLYRNSSYIPNVGTDSGNLKVLFKQCLKQNNAGFLSNWVFMLLYVEIIFFIIK
jgi:hypothetical protein